MKNVYSRPPTEAELKEYIELTMMIKRLEARRDEIKELCKASGSFCSRNFVLSVTDQSRTGLVGLEFVEKALGREILDYHNLIQTSWFQVVRVSKVAKMMRLATNS